MKTYANYKPNIEVALDAGKLAERCLVLFVSQAREAIETRGVFTVAISGGQTPRGFFELLGDSSQAKDLEWDKVKLFWVDERIVRPDSQWSNYKLAADTFLGKVGIPEGNVHRIPTEHSDFQLAAHDYERIIRDAFGMAENEVPVFDLMVLGMGADGHIGSMFPDSYASFDAKNLACVVYVMDEKLNRITLTSPVLRAARSLAVLVSGEEKAAILRKVLTSEPDEVKYPIHTLWPVLDKVTWLVDKNAAKRLNL